MDLSNLILDFSKNPRTCDGIDKSTAASACSKLCGKVRYNYPHRHTRIFVNNLKRYDTDFKFFISMINHETLHHILDKFSERRNYRNGDIGHWPFAAVLNYSLVAGPNTRKSWEKNHGCGLAIHEPASFSPA